jgi:ketosteroid isomerase-like protein
MSRENVELVRSMIEAYKRADFETLAAGCADDFEFTSVLTAVEETSYHGRDVWRAYWADMQEAWEEWHVEAVEILEGRDDSVVVITRLDGRGKSSGVPVDLTVGIHYLIRNGELWRMRSYLDAADALKAAGLAEE